jgi:hypothetical protein
MKRMAVTGFVIWLVATVSLRFGGQYVFRGGSQVLLLIVTLPAMIAVAIVVLRRFPLRNERALAAIALVAPGMLLDTVSAIWFPIVFPNIRAEAAGAFGGWLLFSNVIVLLTAVSYQPAAATK